MLIAGQDARTLAGIPVQVRWAPVPPASAASDASDTSDASVAQESATSVLTPFELGRYRSLRPDAARTFLAGRRLLRDLVAASAGVDTADVAVEARCAFCGGAHGRPAVIAPGSATRLHLGLAHTDTTVVAVAAWDHAVGVDVERSDAAPARERDHAIATVAGASGVDPLAHWTRVEAVLKADGRGLRVDPRTVHIDITDDGVEARVAGTDGTEAHYRLAELDLGPGFMASVAVRR